MNFLQIIHVLPELFSDTHSNNFYYSVMRNIPDCEIGTCVWYFQYELRVLEEFASQMSKLMPVKQEVDMSSLIMAPMPGVLKSVAVKPGDMVRGATVGGWGGRNIFSILSSEGKALISLHLCILKLLLTNFFMGTRKFCEICDSNYWENFSLRTFFVLGGWGTGSLCTGSHEDAEQHDLFTRCQSEWITYHYYRVFPTLWSSWEWLSPCISIEIFGWWWLNWRATLLFKSV